jgi:hypothetical protein
MHHAPGAGAHTATPEEPSAGPGAHTAPVAVHAGSPPPPLGLGKRARSSVSATNQASCGGYAPAMVTGSLAFAAPTTWNTPDPFTLTDRRRPHDGRPNWNSASWHSRRRQSGAFGRSRRRCCGLNPSERRVC